LWDVGETPEGKRPLAGGTNMVDVLADSDLSSTTVPIGGTRQFYHVKLLLP
jgi:hypothetical protein